MSFGRTFLGNTIWRQFQSWLHCSLCCWSCNWISCQLGTKNTFRWYLDADKVGIPGMSKGGVCVCVCVSKHECVYKRERERERERGKERHEEVANSDRKSERVMVWISYFMLEIASCLCFLLRQMTCQVWCFGHFSGLMAGQHDSNQMRTDCITHRRFHTPS